MVFSILEPHKHKGGLYNHNPDGTKSELLLVREEHTTFVESSSCSLLWWFQPLTLGGPFWLHFSDIAMTSIVNYFPYHTHSRYKNCAALKTPARTWQRGGGGGNSAAVPGWGWDR